MATLPTLLAPLSSGFGFFGPPGLYSGHERSSDASLTSSRSLYLALVPATLLATSGWEQTRKVAMGLGGDLAVIDSAPEQAFISDSLQALAALAKDDNRYQALRNYWIGLEDKDPGPSLRWAWTNGMEVATPQGETTWGYKNWAAGQPDNSFGGQDKGVLWGVNTRSDGSLVPRTGNELFQWDDVGSANVSRGDITYSLAEIPVREYNGHFYRLVSGDFSESSEKARALGGSLASVDNDAELQYLRTFLKGNELAWIAPSGSASSALLRADGSRENLNSGQIATFGNPSLGLVEIIPAGNPQAPTSSIYITDVIWPEAKTYASNDKLTVEVKLSAPLDFTYKGKPLKDALASNDVPYGLPLLQTFGMKHSGESYFYKTHTMAVATTANPSWPTNNLKLTLDAKDLAPSGEPGTALIPPQYTLSLAALRLELTGKDEDSGDYWDNSQFALPGNVSLDLTLPAIHQAGKEGFSVQAAPSTTPPTVQTLPISRNASPAYYLNLGDILGTIDRSQDLSKGELQINSKGLGETLSNLAGDRLGSWLNDPVTAVANGHWSSTPVSVPKLCQCRDQPLAGIH